MEARSRYAPPMLSPDGHPPRTSARTRATLGAVSLLGLVACGPQKPTQGDTGAAQPDPAATGTATDLPGEGGDETAPALTEGRSCKRADAATPCCDRDYGVDPEQLRSACGWGEYLGEYRTTTSCQLRFAGEGEQPRAVTLAEFPGLDFQSAVDLHMSGFLGAQDGREVPGAGPHEGYFFSGLGNLVWAHIDGWAAPRRLAWSRAECSVEAMTPIVEALAKAPEIPAPARPAPEAAATPRPLPPGTHEGREKSLLARYMDRPLETPAESELPTHAMRTIVMLLERVAQDRADLLPEVLDPGARWGLPDRRQLRGRPVFEGDAGRSFLDALRGAANRFEAEAKFACPPLSPQGSAMVARGEAPMWCAYHSKDGLDLLVFRLRGSEAGARIDYVGLFETRPSEALRADGEPPPPPMRPTDAIRAERKAAQPAPPKRG